MIGFIRRLLARKYIYRSALTGEFVSRDFAEANPSITYRHRVA
jgi:hypothetical protein